MEKVTPRAVLLVHITTFSAKYLKNGLAGEEGRPHRIQVHLSIFKFRQKVTSKKRIEREKWLFKSNTLDPPSMNNHSSSKREKLMKINSRLKFSSLSQSLTLLPTDRAINCAVF